MELFLTETLSSFPNGRNVLYMCKYVAFHFWVMLYYTLTHTHAHTHTHTCAHAHTRTHTHMAHTRTHTRTHREIYSDFSSQTPILTGTTIGHQLYRRSSTGVLL